MTKKNMTPDAYSEGSTTKELTQHVENVSCQQVALRALITNLFAVLARGIDDLDTRLEIQLNRIEEKLDAVLKQRP